MNDNDEIVAGIVSAMSEVPKRSAGASDAVYPFMTIEAWNQLY